MEDCIFCKLVRGEMPTNNVYEDDWSFAFLDNHPINPGHVLVIPKIHEPNLHKLNEDVYLGVMKTVRKISDLVDIKFNPKKVGLIVAGWDVPHAHVHVVPMIDYHDITSKSILEGKRANPSPEELTEVLKKLVN